MHVALVHERFTDFAGSESVVEQFTRIWPDASIHAPIANPAVLPDDMTVVTSPLNRLYRRGSYAHLLPLLPSAMRHLDIEPVDCIVASHHAFANQVVWASPAPVISYVHSPARWMWDPDMRRGEPGGIAGRAFLSAFSAGERGRDRRAAELVAGMMANSFAVADRIQRWWGRESTVIHPPVNVDFFTPDPTVEREDFLLVAGRLVPYKRPELAVAAARAAGVRLVVAGEGRAMEACVRASTSTTTFLGRVDDNTLRSLYRRCHALVMPGEEDFGIVPVEAMGCGAPVIALSAGGALDYVVPGMSGILTGNGSDAERVAALSTAMHDSLSSDFDPDKIRLHAEEFSPERFRQQVLDFATAVIPTMGQRP